MKRGAAPAASFRFTVSFFVILAATRGNLVNSSRYDEWRGKLQDSLDCSSHGAAFTLKFQHALRDERL